MRLLSTTRQAYQCEHVSMSHAPDHSKDCSYGMRVLSRQAWTETEEIKKIDGNASVQCQHFSTSNAPAYSKDCSHGMRICSSQVWKIRVCMCGVPRGGRGGWDGKASVKVKIAEHEPRSGKYGCSYDMPLAPTTCL